MPRLPGRSNRGVQGSLVPVAANNLQKQVVQKIIANVSIFGI